jgi:hypothetical protein
MPHAGVWGFGFLGLIKGHKNFLQYIPRTVRSLPDTVAKKSPMQRSREDSPV